MIFLKYFVLLSIFTFIIFLPSSFVRANHIPQCTESIKGEIITEAHELHDENPDKSECPPETGCYEFFSGNVAKPYACYKIKPAGSSNTNSTPTQPEVPPLQNLPPNKTGVVCSVYPSTINITGTFAYNASGLKPNTNHRIEINNQTTTDLARVESSNNGAIGMVIDPKAVNIGLSRGIIQLYELGGAGKGQAICYTQITIKDKIEDLPKDQKWYRCDGGKGAACTEFNEYKPGATSDKATCDQACIAGGTTFQTTTNVLLTQRCKDPKDSSFDKNKDVACTSSIGQPCGEGNKGMTAAIGCLQTEPGLLVKDILRFAIGIVGGLAFLLMLFGVFQMITSAGNPQTLKEGQERFTSAVIGLLLIIFSVLLLQIIGVDILNIPGFKP